MPRAFATIALVLLASAGACASSTQRQMAKPQQNLITADEIQKAGSGNVYQLVQSLRPAWLIKHGTLSMNGSDEIIAYVGRSKLGTVDALRDIAAAAVTSVQFLDAAAANYRFGQGHPHGAIVVSTDPIPASMPPAL